MQFSILFPFPRVVLFSHFFYLTTVASQPNLRCTTSPNNNKRRKFWILSKSIKAIEARMPSSSYTYTTVKDYGIRRRIIQLLYDTHFPEVSKVKLKFIRLDCGKRAKVKPIRHRWSNLQIISCLFSFHCLMKLEKRGFCVCTIFVATLVSYPNESFSLK